MHNPATYTEAFDREQGFTPQEWLNGLRGAVGTHRLELGPLQGQALVRIGAGTLHLQWTELPPRRIALLRLPRLAVRYRFNDVPAPERNAFMRYFDLYLQRGGG
jgi:hypothetical protein